MGRTRPAEAQQNAAKCLSSHDHLGHTSPDRGGGGGQPRVGEESLLQQDGGLHRCNAKLAPEESDKGAD